jgi:hypothetical protein
MKKLLLIGFVCLCVMAISKQGMAYGPHDENCAECHSIHASKGEHLPAVNLSQEKYLSGETVKGTDAFCLGCHNAKIGIMPIALTKTHPVGITPKKAKVPASSLSASGLFHCMGCHDPHPANPNYKYLVVDTNGGKTMGKFCNYCHPAQAGVGEAKAPAPKPAAPAPAKKK